MADPHPRHEVLDELKPIKSSRLSRRRIFSIGLNSVYLTRILCGGVTCQENGTAFFAVTISCAATPVLLRVLEVISALDLFPSIPSHGEVCPGDWGYHKVSLTPAVLNATGGRLRFEINVHAGGLYYAMTRWHNVPSFAACNFNELYFDDLSKGYVDLCEAPSAQGDESIEAFVGIYGGRSCADYTISVVGIDSNSSCSTSRTGICMNELRGQKGDLESGRAVLLLLIIILSVVTMLLFRTQLRDAVVKKCLVRCLSVLSAKS